MNDLAVLRQTIENELACDRVTDDVTSRALGPVGGRPAEGILFAKEAGVFSGEAVLRAFPSEQVTVEGCVTEGAVLEKGTPVAKIRGSAAACLSHERTLLNFLSHLCGIATLTRDYVEAVHPHKARILATRKTLPGLRDLQLQAVRAGGGFVHRRSLSDGVLIKDNHLALAPAEFILQNARAERSPLHRIEIEVQNLEQLDRVLVDPPDVIMLDNFDLDTLRVAVVRIGGRCQVEVSGGIRLERVNQIAACGVDFISVGRLTHSAIALDLSMDLQVQT